MNKHARLCARSADKEVSIPLKAAPTKGERRSNKEIIAYYLMNASYIWREQLIIDKEDEKVMIVLSDN